MSLASRRPRTSVVGEHDRRWINVGEISAEGRGTGGGGGNGWVMLPGHDARGAAGINGPMNRWYGGMVHELGHAFGLPDSSSTDGTPMSASFYNYPDTHFNERQRPRSGTVRTAASCSDAPDRPGHRSRR